MPFNQSESREVMSDRLYGICASLGKPKTEDTSDDGLTVNQRAYRDFILKLKTARLNRT